jgi:hypothetical protein
VPAASNRAAIAGFPPRPPARSFRARERELATLASAVRAGEQRRFALVGAGGSGKSTLACALGHRVSPKFAGGIHWFRVGAWDTRTITEMLALRFGVPLGGPRRLSRLRAHLVRRGPTLIVLDNHEDDRAVAELLDALRDAPVTWIITARRCLLAGVSIYPVVPPLMTLGGSPFPRVATLTRLLRWNPVALDLADAIVETGAIDPATLGRWLVKEGVDRVRVIAHEDDLPEVGLLVGWSFAKLSPGARRMLGVLSHTDGDHTDAESLATLARVRGSSALAELERYRLVQQPLRGRFALHATVRHAVAKRTTGDPARAADYYLSLLEQHPERLELEQTHLFAAMDQASQSGNVGTAVRLERLVSKLEER